ncbi:MAG: 3,4-dihydroxy-2-butanone 4-phosphate synthase [Actinomycetia bacterium]|nr:3,4-dihydroxy-2-butanone 4-phosphate synthase [Actinomycetes bacterium]
MTTFDRLATSAAPTASLEQALADIRAGKFVVLVGAADRRSEGTLTIAAQHCDADAVAYMARHGRGIISLCLTEARCDELGLPPMTRTNTSTYQAAFTISIEAREGVSTGISAADRARTIAVAVDPSSTARDLVSPGHIFPLRARPGGVLARVAHTEGAVDLAALAGLQPAAVICGILTPDGSMAGPAEIESVASQLDLTVLAVEDLVAHRRRLEQWIVPAGERLLRTTTGELHAFSFAEEHTGLTHLALVKGDASLEGPVFVHEECAGGDVFGALDCGCGEALQGALETLERTGSGVLVYVAREADERRLQDVVLACERNGDSISPKAIELARQVLHALGSPAAP